MSSNTVPIDLSPLEQDLKSLGIGLDALETAEQHPIAPTVRPEPKRPALQLVPKILQKGAGHSRVFMAVTTIATIGVILASQLVLSIITSEGAYQISNLELTQRDLTRVERVLSQDVQTLSSPQNLADNATKLGMITNATPSYFRLSDGAVIGEVGTRPVSLGANTVPNELLQDMPVVSADGLMVSRESVGAGVATATKSNQPVAWDGLLPAPQTH